ncbi:MAG: Glycosyltransferase [Parcubacteria bacterium C7867-007]|nr:MAG: Glycosyltransferase [Parcubacteria bacterium C7867-007]
MNILKQIRQRLGLVVRYGGWGRRCSLCAHHSRAFISNPPAPGQKVIDQYHIIAMGGRLNYRCPWCGSTDKERLVYEYLFVQTTVFQDASKVLHIAPERNLARVLKSRTAGTYTAGDKFEGDTRYTDGRYGDAVTLDITDIPFPDASFDLVVCNHVLEHVLDDRKALREIYRVLVPGGRAILQVPVSRTLDTSIEDQSITDPKGKLAAFGQADHVRIYSEHDYLERLSGAGFMLEPKRAAEFLDQKTIQMLGLNSEEAVYATIRPV